MPASKREVNARRRSGRGMALPFVLVVTLVAVGLPVIAAANGEQTISGRVEFDHADDFQGRRSERMTMLDTGEERLELVGADGLDLRPGTRVKARGHRQGSKFALSTDDGALVAATGAGSIQGSDATAANATSATDKRVAVLLVNFVSPTPTPSPTPPPTPPPTPMPTDPPPSSPPSAQPSAPTPSSSAPASPAPSASPQPSASATASPSPSPSPSPTPTPPPEPWTVAEVANLYFTGTRSVASYYSELSNGRMSVTGNVFGYFTVTTQTKTCDYSTWGSLAREAATASGVDLTQYTNVVHAFPRQSACWWYGLANLPGRNSWINGQMSLYVTSHELGHNFGVDHAAALTCTRSGERVSYSSNCSADEYGDPYDVMGYTGQRHMSNWHRFQLGFLSGSDMRTVTAHGLYRVAPAEIQGGTPRIVRVARAEGEYYYLEFRQPYGLFDNFSATSAAVNGVMIRVAPHLSVVRSKLIDAVPATSTFNDAILTVGNTFHDPVNTIYVTVVAVGPAGADLHIQAGPDLVPPAAPPTVVATTDGAGAISLSWSAATDDVIVTGYDVLRDGVKVATVTGTSFSETGLAQARTYAYSVRARDRQNAGATTSTSIYLPDTTAPSAPSSPSAVQSGASGVALTWGAATDNVGVTSYRVLRNGVLVATTSGTSFGETGLLEGTSYRYRVRALDAAGNVGPGATADFLIPDVTAPVLGGSLAATFDAAFANTVALTWTPATDNVGVARYSILRDGAWLADSTTAAWSDAAAPAAQVYDYTVQAHDAAGNTSGTLTASIYVPDVTPPQAPYGLTAVLTSADTASLSWAGATDDVAVDHYLVTANGVQLAQSDLPATIPVAVNQGATYRFAVRAVDTTGNVGAESAVYLAVPDVTAPSAVTSLSGLAAGATSASLSWAAASDNVAVASYAITRDGTVIASVPAGTLSYTDTGLASDRTYAYTVAAVDRAGNAGPASSVAVTLISADTTPPTIPANLRGVALGDRRVSLTWNASTDNRAGTIRYRVFRDGARVATVSDTDYVDRPPQVGTFRYRVKAVDGAGNVSAFSASISVYASK